MKKIVATTLILMMTVFIGYSQKLTQTVRGTIVDTDSKTTLIGASVIVAGSEPLIGTTTDVNGIFRIDKVPVGRITLLVSYLGYESKTFSNIIVNSGKEVIIDLSLQEAIVKLNEVVVKPKRKNGEATNEMALISARSVSVEQTKRFAGSFNDPSRILSNFAGVTSTQDGSNDIIVRGNSPKYVQWRLEGVEITNPNHFEDQNSSSGGICALNNSLLATSNFYTGAFTAEFGDVLSGVYDVKLRAGNNEKFESMFGIGIMGTDLTLEGPFKKGYKGSYLVNYRYSTITLLQDMGIADIDGLLKFQDLTAKFVFPTKKIGSFSLFVLGGANGFYMQDIKASLWPTPGDRTYKTEIVEDYDKDNYLINTGMNHTIAINDNSFIHTTLSFSGDGIKDDIFESRIVEMDDGQGGVMQDTIDRTLNYHSKIDKAVYRGALTYSNKINSKNKIKIGTKYSHYDYKNNQSMLDDELTNRINLVDFDGTIGTLRNFVSWKHRLNKNLTLVAGLHNMNVLLTKESTFEPRFAMSWKLNNISSINFGYGNHSNMERIHNYFTQIQQADGTISEPNKNLGMLKANHFVLGYKKQITENLVAKMEVYYQQIYNLPVDNNDTSYYATINEGMDYKFVDLVNKGTGKNYGVELTLERYFTNNYYYLVNASMYESKYKSLEGVERNTRYNGNYLINILCGKEFENLGKKKNKTLALNGKIFFGGGRKIIPLLRDGQGNLAVDQINSNYWDYDKAYDKAIESVYNVTLSVSYKINKPKATHEIFVNIDNLTNTKGRISEFYDEKEPNSIGYMKQMGFFPNLMYRVYF